MNPDTTLIHAGRRFAAEAQMVNPPVARASTVLFPNLAAFKASYKPAAFESLRYGCTGTQTNFELQDMGLFTFELVRCSEEAFSAFIDSLKLFGIGTSWGGFESLVMPAIPHKLRSAERQPDEGRLVLLHIGLEEGGDLIGDLDQALQHVR